MAGMNMQQMMKQARKMQEQLAAAQENLKSQTVDASAGGGMVKVTVNGEMELVNLTIDPDALDPEDVDMLQDMIMAAVNEAVTTARAPRMRERRLIFFFCLLHRQQQLTVVPLYVTPGVFYTPRCMS